MAAGRGVAVVLTGVRAGAASVTGVVAADTDPAGVVVTDGMLEVTVFTLLFASVTGLSLTIDPLVQMAARFSLLISNSITLRRGLIGV